VSPRLKTYKKGFDCSYSLGVFPTLELLAARPEAVRQVVLSTSSAENTGVSKIKSICADRGIDVRVDDRQIAALVRKGNCYALGVFGKYPMRLDPLTNHVVLVNPSDAGNLGTIMRTMVAFGTGSLAIVLPGVDPFDPKVIRASMGAVFRMTVEEFDSFDDYRSRFDRQFYPFMLGGTKTLCEAASERVEPYSMIFGNEASGLSDDFTGVGTSVIIPHSQDVDSLNLAVAVAVAQYEFSLKR
jgi:TrmH family RNA methyltransferase